jgi:hypothetical protein
MLPFSLESRWHVAGIVLVVCLVIPACGNPKITKANYEKIQMGMTLQQVEEILGKGEKEEGGDGSNVAGQFGVDVGGGLNLSARPNPGESYKWETGTKTITVYFLSGRVTNKVPKGL